MDMMMSSEKWRPFCQGGDELNAADMTKTKHSTVHIFNGTEHMEAEAKWDIEQTTYSNAFSWI